MPTPACFSTRVPSSGSFSVTKFCRSNKYLMHNLPTLPSSHQVKSLKMWNFIFHIHIAAAPIPHNVKNLLCYKYVGVILPGLCISTPIAIYDAKGSHPAEGYGLTCQGIYPDTGYNSYTSVSIPCSHILNLKNVCAKIFLWTQSFTSRTTWHCSYIMI